MFNVALPAIARDLSASATDVQWVNTAYVLVFGGFLLTAGTVADKFGRRRVMVAGLVLFGVGSLAVVAAHTAAQLIALRAVVGLGAAMLAPGTLALSFRLFGDDALRMRAVSLISAVGMAAIALGPVLGGLGLEFASWRWLLMVNGPIAVLAVAGVLLGIPADDP